MNAVDPVFVNGLTVETEQLDRTNSIKKGNHRTVAHLSYSSVLYNIWVHPFISLYQVYHER